MNPQLKWQNVVILCTGVVVVGAILITAMLLGKNGALLAGGLTIIGSVLTGAATFNLGRNSMRKELVAVDPGKPDAERTITPPA